MPAGGDRFDGIWDPGATFGLRSGGEPFLWHLERPEITFGLRAIGGLFWCLWNLVEPLLGLRLAGTSLVSFGASWDHFWDPGRQGPCSSLFGIFGATSRLDRGSRKHFYRYLGCDGGGNCVHLVA